MFERFTEKAIKVIMLAQEEARRLGHNYVGTEQLLLGLCGEGTGIAAKALKGQGISLKDARTAVENVIGRGSGFVQVEIPFTTSAKVALEKSWDEARSQGVRYIGTEHLLLGVLGNDSCVAAEVLRNMKVDFADLRKSVVGMIADSANATSKEYADYVASGPKRSSEPGPAPPPPPTTTQTCPNCSETVKLEALVCYFCGYGISDEHFVDCQFCKERIRKEATKCRYCFTIFEEPPAASRDAGS